MTISRNFDEAPTANPASLRDKAPTASSGSLRPAPTASSSSPRTALVLEGGGLRGAFAAGVVAALDRLHSVRPDYAFATSAAGPSAAFLATGQIELAIRLWENRTHASHLISPLHLLQRRPLMDVDKLVDSFRSPKPLLVERFADSHTRVFISVTNCRTGEPEYVGMGPDNAFSLLTATMALPVAYGRVVRLCGEEYIDGGLTAPIPLEPALQRNIENIIVVLTQPAGYRKKPSRTLRVSGRLTYPRYPELWPAFQQRAERYNRTADLVDELEARGRLSVIRPPEPLPASRMTRRRDLILKTIQAGRDSARLWLRTQSSDTFQDSPGA